MVSKGLCFFPAISEDLTKTLSLPPNHNSLATTPSSLLKHCNFSTYEIMTIFNQPSEIQAYFLSQLHGNYYFIGNP